MLKKSKKKSQILHYEAFDTWRVSAIIDIKQSPFVLGRSSYRGPDRG